MGTELTVVRQLLNALLIATERAIDNEERLLKAGYGTYNRGQFLMLVRSAVEAALPHVQDASLRSEAEYYLRRWSGQTGGMRST